MNVKDLIQLIDGHLFNPSADLHEKLKADAALI